MYWGNKEEENNIDQEYTQIILQSSDKELDEYFLTIHSMLSIIFKSIIKGKKVDVIDELTFNTKLKDKIKIIEKYKKQ